MIPVFLDTVGMIANWDETDQWHTEASLAFLQLLRRRCPLLTTSFVLLECGNAAARRTYRQDVCELRKYLSSEGLLVEPDQAEIDVAWQQYQLGKVGQAGIVDQVSFQVMRRLGIQEAFTNDKHFEAAGFKVLF
jgi:uncharacterized protein